MSTKAKNTTALVNSKVGYKQTKLGWIPEDWKVCTFADIADKKVKWSITGGPFGSDLKAEHYRDKGVRVIQLQNIGDGEFRDKSKIYTSLEKADQLLACNIFPGEIILSKMGDPVARACNIPNAENRWVMGSDGIRLVIDESQFDKGFVLDYINYSIFRNLAISRSTGSTRRRIGLVDLKKIPFIKLAIQEQQKIASILNTWDKAIAAQEKLILEKHELKKGLVSNLIQGELRFRNKTAKWKKTPLGKIPDDWSLIKLKDLTVEKGIVRGPFGGALKKEIFVEKGYKVYEQKNAIYKTIELGKYFINEKKFNELKRFSVREKDLIISCSGTIGRIYEIPQNSPEGVINQALLKLTLNNKVVLNDFFVEQFKWNRIQSTVIDSTQGGAMKNLVSISEFRNTNFIIPPIEEQKYIVSLFNSSKQEIENLELKLKKLKEQKQGLMQQLLTGEKRVNI